MSMAAMDNAGTRAGASRLDWTPYLAGAGIGEEGGALRGRGGGGRFAFDCRFGGRRLWGGRERAQAAEEGAGAAATIDGEGAGEVGLTAL
jgi:hypothetical protein